MSVAENFKAVQKRIATAATRAGRDPSAIRLVTVTKTVDRDRIREAIAAGALVLGENRVQEAKEKIEALGRIASWHLIGHLQTNKAKYAVKLFGLIHSVDNLELAKEIDKQAAKNGKVQDVLIEVSIAGEAAKAGVSIGDMVRFIREVAGLTHIRVLGLMTMPPLSNDPEDSRPHFRKLRDLADAVRKEGIAGISMNELSMGMSGDFEVGIEEGATLVRVGSAIFGERN
jgi:pyridoxal phosphate enzyme (YggS family)